MGQTTYLPPSAIPLRALTESFVRHFLNNPLKFLT